MSNPAVANAVCQCVFGAAPATLTVNSQTTVEAMDLPVGTIMDNEFVSFGMCSCPNAPAVIQATAAKLGVFTPAPCAPMIPGPWAKGEPSILVCGKPMLTSTIKLMCAYGGMISIQMTPTLTINTP